ncbi:MAG: hypothetical protein WA254_06835 [Candidatus Sulfotelmatobacter sp.]
MSTLVEIFEPGEDTEYVVGISGPLLIDIVLLELGVPIWQAVRGVR